MGQTVEDQPRLVQLQLHLYLLGQPLSFLPLLGAGVVAHHLGKESREDDGAHHLEQEQRQGQVEGQEGGKLG